MIRVNKVITTGVSFFLSAVSTPALAQVEKKEVVDNSMARRETK